jgi:hypothetical protein
VLNRVIASSRCGANHVLKDNRMQRVIYGIDIGAVNTTDVQPSAAN